MSQVFPAHWDVLPFSLAVKDATSEYSKLQKSEYLEQGRFPIVDQGQQKFGGYTDDESVVSLGGCPAVVFGDHTRIFKFIDEPFCLGADGAKVLEPKVELDKKFLFYYLSSLNIESAGYSRHFKFLKENVVPVPPLPEQKRIAAILDKADAIRRKRQQAIQLADGFLRAVFLDMFGDPVTNPKGWPLKRFGEVGTWSSGGTPSRTVSDFFEGEINWYSAGELNSRYLDGSVEKISELAIKNSAAKIFKKGSLLVGMYDTAAMKISILKEDSSCNQACANVECNELASVEWLYSYIDYAKDSYLSRRRGVRQKNLNLGMIRDFLLPLPPRDLQDEFVRFVSAVFGMKKKQDEYKDFPVFESLSLKAFSGQL
ncbi:restriction endonuclease subunit S [Pseudomonas oryzihabitans]|uniref:restriction endonuclease subunit S n=1 Tax=Pseudomonas oryzihabitans TaxID=47885 RepID=UPI001643CF3F|nr:restriction endonuclease subunit S [Pseudomonas oryzihabitans]